MRFNSAIDKKLYGILFLVFLSLAIFFIIMEVLLAAAILFLILAYVVHLTKNTYYEIKGNILIVKAGFMYTMQIEIGTILSIKKSNNLLSSPALSFDRLEIRYNKYDSILISPKQKELFIQELINVNPTIKVTL